MLPFKRAKIVATLGPASDDKKIITKLVKAGANVFRLNFSHGSHTEHKKRYDIIRDVEKELKTPIGILQDLQGPKLRLGTFTNGKVKLKKGKKFILTLKKVKGDENGVTLPHPEIIKAVKKGQTLLLDDGKMRLKIDRVSKDTIYSTIQVNGTLSDRKGVNVPGAVLPISALTTKDRKDLKFGLKLGVDWIAMSFVQKEKDVIDGKKLIAGKAGLLVKLEKPSAVENKELKKIIEHADAVMVARGDLGGEMLAEDVPMIQKRIIRQARKKGRPVIVATQMLESMIEAPTPTRAEVTAVSNAVLEGAEAVMLSAESATGKYPVASVDMMKRIITSVENDDNYDNLVRAGEKPLNTQEDAISIACSQVSQAIKSKAIVSFSKSGGTIYRVARNRPPITIAGLTPDVRIARRLTVVWGVVPITTPDIKDVADVVKKSSKAVKDARLCKKGDNFVITAGAPFGVTGTTNMLRIVNL